MEKEDIQYLAVCVADIIKQDTPMFYNKPVYTTTEAALFLGVKRSYLYELVRGGKIPYFRSKGGKMIYIRREDLLSWAESTYVPSKTGVEASLRKTI